jgi:hypothetical protein
MSSQAGNRGFPPFLKLPLAISLAAQREAVTLAGIEVAIQAPDGMIGGVGDPHVLEIDNRIVNPHPHHFPQDKKASWLELKALQMPAFEGHRRFRNAIRPYQMAGFP